ncbi:MAG: ATP-binding cassette domain-containing protein [Chloroflexi bacterium]|nr:ATP-binding cassette domain-containing protein [Chloroflexota bacterium]
MNQGWIQHRLGNLDLQVRWEAAPSEILVLFGPSGAGKTTILRAIAGLLQPQAGHIEVGGRPVFDSAQRLSLPPERRRVGYVPQSYALFPHLTVRQNVAYGLTGLPQREVEERVASLLTVFGLTGLAERSPRNLSGGEAQRTALARALAPQPQLLLLDEPFAALDAELRRALRRELRTHVAERQAPTILVTHDREEAIALGHSLIVLDRGRQVAEGPPLSLLTRPSTATVARLFGIENVYRLRVLARHPREGTMEAAPESKDLRLVLPLGDAPEGSWLTAGVPATEVLVASQEPQGLSAQNLLPGVTAVIEESPPHIRVTLDCGVPVVALVTPRAVERLGLAVGQRAWAVIKASSFSLLAE